MKRAGQAHWLYPRLNLRPEPGTAARRPCGIAPSQVFSWRRLGEPGSADSDAGRGRGCSRLGVPDAAKAYPRIASAFPQKDDRGRDNNGALDAAAGLDHLLVRSLVPPSAPISAGEDDVLVYEDVELVSWANLQCRLNVEILVDRAFGDAAERLREISPCGVGRRVLGGER